MSVRDVSGTFSETVLPDLAATEAFGARLADAVAEHTLLCLSGPLGAGKSALARQIIRTRTGRPELPVPSPTYTLVNVYETPDGSEIWHADLYRLGDHDELRELGLDDAIGRVLTIVEWPERMPPVPDVETVHIDLRHEGQGRIARVTASHGLQL